jgi:hypothetical protein
LAKWNVQANGSLVAHQLLEFRQRWRSGSSLASQETRARLPEGQSAAPVGERGRLR